MTILHDTFTLERTFDSTPKEVWHAWTDPELRTRWFHAPPGWHMIERTLAFKVGGGEVMHGKMPNGTETRFVSRYHAIVPERSIILDYDMHVGGSMMSVSLATLSLEAAGPGTRLLYTEQGVYIDGNPESPAGRKKGTSWHLDNLVELLAK